MVVGGEDSMTDLRRRAGGGSSLAEGRVKFGGRRDGFFAIGRGESSCRLAISRAMAVGTGGDASSGETVPCSSDPDANDGDSWVSDPPWIMGSSSKQPDEKARELRSRRGDGY